MEGPATDVAIIGGSFAGLSAALMLARGRRRVIVFDDGQTRNRFAAASHGFLGQDGQAPDAIRLTGRAEVLAYPTASVDTRRVQGAQKTGDAFSLTLADGDLVLARRIILAYGMRDVLPAIPGLAECWGVTANQCPYCHGYELADRPTLVMLTGPHSVQHAMMLTEWTRDLTCLTHGQDMAPADAAALSERGIALRDGVVSAVHHRNGHIEAVELADGARIAGQVLYLASTAVPACDLATDLGCAMEPGGQGPIVKVDWMQATSVAGVWAAGDLARQMPGAVHAAASGAMAGVAVHRSLMGF